MNINRFFYKNMFGYLILTMSISSSYSVFADHNDYGANNGYRINHQYVTNNGYGSNQYQGVTLYSDCDFSGKADSVNVGNYNSLQRFSVGNDSVSSIRVPRGLVVIIYENDNFEGEQQRIYQDVACVPKRWNDRISSIAVFTANNEQTRDDWNGRNNRGSGNHGYSPNHSNSNYPNRGHPNSGYGNNQYNHVANNQRPHCYDYKVHAYGGAGAFRFADKADSIIKVNSNAQNGNTCRKGSVRIELSKTEANTTTVFEINGQRYTFAANEKHDSYKNNWYRKYIDLYLP